MMAWKAQTNQQIFALIVVHPFLAERTLPFSFLLPELVNRFGQHRLAGDV
jgi:hypothetical protein